MNYLLINQSRGEEKPRWKTIAAVVAVSVSTLVAICLFIGGVGLLVWGEAYVEKRVKEEINLADTDGFVFKAWLDTDNAKVPITQNFYVWNLTNPEAVVMLNATPDVRRIGPFVYRQRTYVPLSSVRFKANKSLVQYHYGTDLTFDRERSVDPHFGQLEETTNFTTVNIPFASVSYRASLSQNPLVGILCSAIGNTNNGTIVGPTGIFVSRSVKEVLFGYDDPILEVVKSFTSFADPNYKLPTKFQLVFNHSVPAPSPYTFIGGATCPLWNNQTQCNTTFTSPTTIRTGLTDHGNSIAEITEWAGQSRQWWWESPHNGTVPTEGEGSGACGTLQGTNGFFNPPGLTQGNRLHVFLDTMYRSFPLSFSSKSTVSGVPTLRFRFDPKIFTANSTAMSRCTHSERYNNVWNMSDPFFGPIFASSPLFAGPSGQSPLVTPNGEPDAGKDAPAGGVFDFTVNGSSLSSAVSDMQARDELRSSLEVEPHSGILIRGRARIQFSTWLRSMQITGCNLTTTTKVPPVSAYTFLPVMYVDIHVDPSEVIVGKITKLILDPLKLIRLGGWIAIITGSVIILIIAVIGLRVAFRRTAAAQEWGMEQQGDAAFSASLEADAKRV